MAVALEFLRDDGVAAAGAGEAGGLGHGAELDGTGAGAFHLEDAAGRIVDDEVLVGGIIDDDGVVLVRVVDPLLQLLFAVGSTGGVVRGAEVDEVRVDALVGHGAEAVLLGGGSIDDLAAGHDVRVDIDGIHRVGDEDDVVLGEDVLQVRAVGLGTVGDEDLVRTDVHAEALVVVRDGFPDEVVTFIVGVALEALLVCEVLGAFLQRVDGRFAERERDIADAHADDGLVGVCGDVLIRFSGNVREKVIRNEVVEVRVDLHFIHPFKGCWFPKFAESIPQNRLYAYTFGTQTVLFFLNPV